MNLRTKKIILITTSIIIILIDLFTGFNMFNDTTTQSNDLIVGISNQAQSIFLFICVFTNLLSIFFIVKNPLKYKKILIFLNIISLFIGSIFNIICSIFNIIILTRKTKKDTNDINNSNENLYIEDDFQENSKPKELPDLENITKYKWYVYLIIFIFLFIICYTPLLSNYFGITKLFYFLNEKNAEIVSTVLLYIIQIILLAIPMWNEIKRDFLIFKNNFKLYLSKTLPQFCIILIFYFISNLSIMLLFAVNVSTNQEIINSLPLYVTAFLGIIVAPFSEELMFRGFIKKFINNNILFVIVSSLIFGVLHVVSADSIRQFMFIIPYSILGLALSLNYVKTKNIASNMFLHSAWNTLAVIGMILLKFVS